MKASIKLLFAAILMAVAVDVSAQYSPIKIPTPEEIAQKETERMTKNLSLTSDQQPKIQAINLKYAEQRRDAAAKVKKEGQPTEQEKAQWKADMQKSIAAQEVEFKSIFTDKQYQTYLKNKEVAKEKMGARLGQR